jgi:hypothetical protein
MRQPTQLENSLRAYLDKHAFQKRTYRKELLKNALNVSERLKGEFGLAQELRQAYKDFIFEAPEYESIINIKKPVTIRRDEGERGNVKVMYDIRVPFITPVDLASPRLLDDIASAALWTNNLREYVTVLHKRHPEDIWRAQYRVMAHACNMFSTLDTTDYYDGDRIAQLVVNAIQRLTA